MKATQVMQDSSGLLIIEWKYRKPSIDQINWGEPFVEISEDPIYPAVRAKSPKRF